MANNKKRNLLLVLLLLLLIAAAVYFFCCNKKTVTREKFSTQGNTTLKSDTAEIRLWDYGAVDGDTVQVYFDGKMIFERLGLTDTPAVYSSGKLSKGEHWIGIKAITEGNPPATPHISIGDGKEKYEFDIDATVDSSASWSIIVQ